MEGKRTVVTGAAGFIGSHLVDRLLNDGAYVRGIDNFASGRSANLDHFLGHDRFTFIDGDLRDELTIMDLVEDVDVIFHQGAIASVPRSVSEPVLTAATNCLGTTILLNEARKADVDRVVVASSSAVYGPDGELPKQEDMPANPESPYALSKYWTEQMAVQAADFYDIDTVALRYFNVFGPRQDPESDYAAVIPNFIRLMLNGERPVIYGDGEQSRDFVYVDDVVEANLAAATAPVSSGVFNVARGERTTINELVESINDIIDTDLDPIHDDPRPGDIRHSVADISRITEALEFSPAVSVTDGLRRTIDWFNTYRLDADDPVTYS